MMKMILIQVSNFEVACKELIIFTHDSVNMKYYNTIRYWRLESFFLFAQRREKDYINYLVGILNTICVTGFGIQCNII